MTESTIEGPAGDLDHKQQEWFEVFFDLVSAVAVSLWAEQLAKELTLAAYVRSGRSLLAIWWVWLGQTVFATRFPAGSRTIEALSIVQVIAVGVMATPPLQGKPTSSLFPPAFVTARLALFALYAPFARAAPPSRPV